MTWKEKWDLHRIIVGKLPHCKLIYNKHEVNHISIYFKGGDFVEFHDRSEYWSEIEVRYQPNVVSIMWKLQQSGSVFNTLTKGGVKKITTIPSIKEGLDNF